MTPSDVLAVVVSYNGGDAIAPTVSALRSQGVRVHIVDNGSDAPTLAALDALAQDAGVSVELLGRNLGVGHALNRGVVKARALGATWLLTMDQDSLVDSGLVAAYARAAARHPGGVCFAPTIDDSHHGENDRDASVPYAITSGSVVRLSAFDEIGGYDEGFFIDCIDFDFSLRLRRRGHAIQRVHDARMRHRLGEAVTLPAFVRRVYARHSPARRYYMFRNYLYMAERYLLRFPTFIVKLGVLQLVLLPFIAVFDRRRLASFRAVVSGVADYARRRHGPYPGPAR